jgi:hypothetical protein
MELLLMLAFAASLAAVAVPLAARVSGTSAGRAAAGFVAGRVRATRAAALATNRMAAILIDHDEPSGRWTFRQCYDANGDGVRRADVEAGDDPCDPERLDIGTLFPGVELLLSEDVPDVDGSRGTGAEGVRFGRASMISCAPTGRCSPGTLYLRTRAGLQWSVRVAGATGRTRVLRFRPEIPTWSSS